MNPLKLPTKVSVFLMLLVVLLLVILNINNLWSQSVDLAHHYALTYRLTEYFSLPKESDPTLGEMNYYPRISHGLAAVFGYLVGSPLLGLQIVTLVSLYGIWFSYVFILSTLPRKISLFSLFFLAIAFLFNHQYLHIEMHGGEVVGNFFYSQLVGQAVTLLATLAAIITESRAGRLATYSLLVGTVFVNTGIHLLPTLELLGMLGMVLLISAYESRLQRSWFKTIAPVIIVSGISLLCIIKNPAFAAMRQIAENDGSLTFTHISYPFGLFGLCIAVLLLSVITLKWYLGTEFKALFLALKYLSGYGVSVSAFCLLQMVLVNYGYGSDYAVKKYGFGLLSVFVVLLSVVLAGVVDSLFCRMKQSSYVYVVPLAIVAPVVLFIIGITTVQPQERYELSNLVRAERSINGLLSSGYSAATPPLQDVVIGVSKIPAFDYMFSLALTQTPRAYAIPDVLIAHSVEDFTKYSNIVTSIDSKRYDSLSCRRNSNRVVALESAVCIASKAAEAETCSGTFDFTLKGDIPASKIKGFSIAEADGRWMMSREAGFSCSSPKTQPRHLLITANPFFYGNHQRQRLNIKINGQQVYSGEFLKDGAGVALQIDLPVIASGSGYDIVFDTPDAVSPKDLGISMDDRALSFYVKKMVFQ